MKANTAQTNLTLHDAVGKLIQLDIKSDLSDRVLEGTVIGWSSWPKPSTAPPSYNGSSHLFEVFFAHGRSERFGNAEDFSITIW